MIMEKKPIVILDEGFQGINIFKGLSEIYKNEDFVYVNDYLNYPYEGKEEEVINKYVKEKIEFIKMLNVKALIIVNSAIIEYCDNYLQNLKLPLVRIDEAIISYIASEYEQKNIALVAPESIIKANIYQKNFKYNHLYAIFSDELEKVVMDKKVKTALSFSKMREAVKFILNKEVDIFLMVDSIIENLYTEIHEYINTGKMSSMTEVIDLSLKHKNICNNTKGRGKRYIYSDLEKKEFMEKAYFFNMKCDYELIENKKQEIIKKQEKQKAKELKKKK